MNFKLKLLILVFITFSLCIYLYYYETKQVKELFYFNEMRTLRIQFRTFIDLMNKNHNNRSIFLTTIGNDLLESTGNLSNQTITFTNCEGLFFHSQVDYGIRIINFRPEFVYSDETKNFLQNHFGDADHGDYELNNLIASDIRVINMKKMFKDCKVFNQNIISWNVSEVTNMNNMFENCEAFNQDITTWYTPKLTDSYNMFNNATQFLENYERIDGSNSKDGPPNAWQKKNINVSSTSATGKIFKPSTKLELMEAINKMGQDPSDLDSFLKYDPDENQPSNDDSNPGDHSNGVHIGDWDVSEIIDMSHIFSDLINHASRPRLLDQSAYINITTPDVYNRKTARFLKYVFGHIDHEDYGLNNWDVSNVTNMDSMFLNASKFNQNISRWNVENVLNMSRMFSTSDGADNPPPGFFKQDITNWKTHENLDSTGMFSLFRSRSIFHKFFRRNPNCEETRTTRDDGPPSCWEKIIGFKPATKLQLIEAINKMGQNPSSKGSFLKYDPDQAQPANDVENPGYHSYGFHISEWDVSEIIDMSHLFSFNIRDENNNYLYNQQTRDFLKTIFGNADHGDYELNNWNVSNVITMERMFSDCNNFNQYIGSWNISNVEDISNMFYYCQKFNKNINTKTIILNYEKTYVAWDTSNIKKMNSVFYEATTFNQKIENWNTSNVKEMKYLFGAAKNFNKNINTKVVILDDNDITYDAWDTSNVELMNKIFYDAENFNQDIGNWNTSKVKDMSGMFFDAENFNQDIGNWITDNVEDMSLMFANVKKFNQDISNWNTSKVKNFNNMFSGALSFNQDISNWITNNLENTQNMFKNASAFLNNFIRHPNCEGTQYDGPPSCWSLKGLNNQTTSVSIINNDTQVPSNTNTCYNLEIINNNNKILNTADENLKKCKNYCKDKNCKHFKVINTLFINN